jgi:hypothetical protein
MEQQSSKEKKAILLDLTDKEIAQGVAKNLMPFLKQQFDDFITEFYEDKNVPMSMEDACHWLGVGRTTFSKIISRGDIPFKPLNPDNPKSKKLIIRSDLLAYMERNKTKSVDQIKREYNGED